MNKEQPIGIFDSGLGGLSVYKELKRLLPQEKFVDFGDTARVPYGNKSSEVIRRYAFEIAYFLAQKRIKLLVVACNTASSIALNELENAFRFPVVGVVQSAAMEVGKLEKISRIGIIGTSRTIKSATYQNLIKSRLSHVEILAKPCPLFVPIIEEGLFESRVLDETMDFYLNDMRKRKIEVLILGCTHYPLIEKKIMDYFNEKVKLINPGFSAALRVKTILGENNLLNDTEGYDEFFLSDEQENFQKIARDFLGFDIPEVCIIKENLI